MLENAGKIATKTRNYLGYAAIIKKEADWNLVESWKARRAEVQSPSLVVESGIMGELGYKRAISGKL